MSFCTGPLAPSLQGCYSHRKILKCCGTSSLLFPQGFHSHFSQSGACGTLVPTCTEKHIIKLLQPQQGRWTWQGQEKGHAFGEENDNSEVQVCKWREWQWAKFSSSAWLAPEPFWEVKGHRINNFASFFPGAKFILLMLLRVIFNGCSYRIFVVLKFWGHRFSERNYYIKENYTMYNVHIQ